MLTRCGLVMKEDITQLSISSQKTSNGCGLVMKEDITQHPIVVTHPIVVVVW